MELTPPHESTAADGKRTTESGAPVLVTTDRRKNWRELARDSSVAIKRRSPGGTRWIGGNRVILKPGKRM